MLSSLPLGVNPDQIEPGATARAVSEGAPTGQGAVGATALAEFQALG
jgi:hypothetical protein